MIEIDQGNDTSFSIAFVYGSPSTMLRKRLWADLSRSTRDIKAAWLTMGDFNSVATQEEISNQATYNSRPSADFNKWIFDEGLVDMGYTGPRFTWMRGVTTDNFKGAHLDRAMCTTEWLCSHLNYEVNHLPIYCSDHAPLKVQVQDGDMKARCKNFISSSLDYT